MPRQVAAVPASTPATPLVRAFGREFARAGGLLSPDYLESGLSLSEARCLYEIGHASDIELSEVAERVDLDLGYVSRAVSRLAARKLVTKQVAARDSRARSIVLTAKGKRQLVALDRHANARLDRWLAGAPAPALAQLAGGLSAFLGRTHDAHAPVVMRDLRPGELGHQIARHGQIYTGEFGYPAIFEGYVVQAFAGFMASFAPPRDRFFIAERAGEIIGSIASKGLPDHTAQLRFLIVEASARGLGLGRQLVGGVLEHARACGDRRVVLDTASDLTAARTLYTSFGFVKVAEVADEPWLPAGVLSERWHLDL